MIAGMCPRGTEGVRTYLLRFFWKKNLLNLFATSVSRNMDMFAIHINNSGQVVVITILGYLIKYSNMRLFNISLSTSPFKICLLCSEHLLRFQLGDDLLNDYLVTYIEKNIFEALDNEAIVQRFQNMKSHKGLM